MRVGTDDEVYRVDAVWLGPPKATFPWRARYVAWGVGIVVFFATLTVERELGFGFGFFTAAWALVITVALTRFITHRISHERPLGAVLAMWMGELHTPRERSSGIGGAASATRIRVHAQRPRPRVSTARARSGQRVTPNVVNAPNTSKGARRAKGRSTAAGAPPRHAIRPQPIQPQIQQPAWEPVQPNPPSWAGPQAARQPFAGSPRAVARPARRRGRSARR